VVAALFVATSCTVINMHKSDGGIKPSDSPITVDKVDKDNVLAQFGASQHPRILRTYGGEYKDVKLERMVAKIVGRLSAVSNNPQQVYRVTILNSPNVNAFALPGGYIYMTRGLLALANDSSEVAAVIAHEMGHITANHAILRQQKEQEVELTNQIATEVLSDKKVEQETEIKGKLRLAQFSRNQELQADAIGIKTVGEAGYDPFASPRFLQTMEAYSSFRNVSGATDAKLDFLATHPATPQRIKLATAEARKISAPGVGATDRNSFLDGIDGMLFGDTPDEGYTRGNQFIHPKLGISFAVPENFVISNSAAAVIASGPNDIAVRFDAVALPAKATPADYIQSGWVSGLNHSTVRSLTINGLSAARASAASDRWQFDVVVIVVRDRVYRFITAAPKNSPSLSRISTETINSFKILTKNQIAQLKPLRIRVMTVKTGETVKSVSAYMQGTEKKEKLFRILNALSSIDSLSPGERVKIIAE